MTPLADLSALEREPLALTAEQMFSRVAGAPLIAGNSVRVLRDSTENYPAWLQAIESARHRILFENYIVADDEVGRMFVNAMTSRARAGVEVFVMYDWMGALGAAGSQLWDTLRSAGGEVRCFNPPRLDSPFGWLTRDHRKLLAVDGRVGYVGGLCASAKWSGDPNSGVEPWRDTAAEIIGPAVAQLEQAFSVTWAEMGPPLLVADYPGDGEMLPAGDVALRVLATQPNTARIYRLDQLIAAMATERLWLADAYFLGVSPYVQALRSAALDGVDVRLLVPGASDLAAVASLSRAGYRSLLEAGVRVFEWNGPMMHAKTAVADGRWARIGSSNLNVASWLGNYEIDIAIDHPGLAGRMDELYREDLEHATEIVLEPRNRVRSTAPGKRTLMPRRGRRGSASRAAAGALRFGNTVTAAIANRRVLRPAEAGIMAGSGAALLVLAIVVWVWPLSIAAPFVLFAAWIGVALLLRARRLRARREVSAASTDVRRPR